MKLCILTEVGGGPWASAAEIGVIAGLRSRAPRIAGSMSTESSDNILRIEWSRRQVRESIARSDLGDVSRRLSPSLRAAIAHTTTVRTRLSGAWPFAH